MARKTAHAGLWHSIRACPIRHSVSGLYMLMLVGRLGPVWQLRLPVLCAHLQLGCAVRRLGLKVLRSEKLRSYKLNLLVSWYSEVHWLHKPH